MSASLHSTAGQTDFVETSMALSSASVRKDFTETGGIAQVDRKFTSIIIVTIM